MAYLLDTDICVYLLNRKAPYWRAIAERIVSVREREVFLSALTVAELRYGVAKSEHSLKNQLALDTFLADFDLIDFSAHAAAAYGGLRAGLEKAGRPIGPLDTLIAAQALSLDATLVTHNTREFSRVPGLKLADWTKPS